MSENRKICYIFGAMEIGDLPLSPAPGDLLIAADAGLSRLIELGLTPDLIVGDFDSLRRIPSEKEGKIIVHPVEKDDTDTLLAVREGLRRGYSDFVIAGALGGRLDHTLANLQTLVFLAKSAPEGQNHGYLVGEGRLIALLSDESLRLHAAHRGILSLFCVGDRATVTLSGLKYPLDRYPMTPAFPIGVSNEFIGRESEIRVENGCVWMILDGNLAEIEEIRQNRRKL